MMELLKDLLASMDIAALERVGPQNFRLIGSLPGWFVRMYPESVMEDKLHFGSRFLFLENFLIDAEKFWNSNNFGRIKSGIWLEVDSFSRERKLEASALNLKDRKILLIEFVGAEFDEKQALIQKGREQKLDLRKQKKVKRSLEKTVARFDALLQVIPQTVLFFNDKGICIDYVGEGPDEYIGKSVVGIFPEDYGIQLLQRFPTAIKKGSIENMEYQVRAESGTRGYVARVVASGENEVLVLIRPL